MGRSGGRDLPDVGDFAERVIDSWEGAVAQHHGEFCQCRHLERGLDLIERLAVGGVTDTQTIVGQGAVLVLVGRDIDVGVVEVIV